MTRVPTRSILSVLAVGYAAGVIVIVIAQARRDQVLSYTAVSVSAHAADVVAGLALLGASVLAALGPGRIRLALVTVLAGGAWFGPDWEGWGRGPELVRSLGAVASPLLLALLVDLAFTLLWRQRDRLLTGAALGVYAVAAVTVIGRTLFRAPYLDSRCWRDCLGNTFLVHPDPQLAQGFTDAWQWASILIGSGVLLVALGARKARPPLLPGILAVGAAAAVQAAYAAALLYHPAEDPRSVLFSSIFFARAGLLTLLALGIAWAVLDEWRARAGLARLAAELDAAPASGDLESALADAVGDPTLEVAYWARSKDRYIDARGQPTQPPNGRPGRAATPILRAGEPVAVVGHDAGVLDGDELAKRIGSTARLAVDNERLQAEILGQLADLRASRVRVVETADSARRQLERDLHDGAQQSLLAVSYELQLALAGADADGNRELAGVLATALQETSAATVALRELAHGIYPAVLAEAGIGPALERLVDSAPIPVELVTVPKGRHELTTETAAYVIVADALVDATSRNASRVTVAVFVLEGRLVVTFEDDGAPRRSPLTSLADRIGALEGRLEAEPTSLRAEIPCV